MNTKRYTLSDAHSTLFYQLPKWLVALRIEDRISNEAILLYTYLRDRIQLSLTNKWIDENGEAYIYFKREQMEKLLGCKKDKVQKIVKELKDTGLLDEIRQGLNKPNRLYLRYPDSADLTDIDLDLDGEIREDVPEDSEKASIYAECGKTELRSAEISQSGLRKIRSLDCCENAPNNTENNKTEYNKTICQRDDDLEKRLQSENVPQTFVTACANLIREIAKTPVPSVRVGKQMLPAAHVRDTLHSLTPAHIRDVYAKTQSVENVRNPKAYILTLLYSTAQDALNENVYAQFFAHHTPSYDLEEYEQYDIFAQSK